MALNIAKHKNIFLKILKDIYTDPTISTILGFKGGTAALLFYGLDRFSVDIDLDLLDPKQEDYVFERVKMILQKYGKLKEARKKMFNLLYLLSYDDKDINAQNIKLEINRRNFGSRYTVHSSLGIAMQVMIKEDMFANKLCAMYERIGKTNRDIFDVHFFSSHDWPINKELIEERLKIPYKDFLGQTIEKMENFNDSNILSGMGELLTEKQKDWVKTKLKTETLFFLKMMLSNEN